LSKEILILFLLSGFSAAAYSQMVQQQQQAFYGQRLPNSLSQVRF
jgi:hypothetical protein